MIAIIDYGAGNVASVANALKKLNVSYEISDDIKTLNSADKIILPGVGEASFAMNELNNRNLINFIKNCTKPLLGICLGMQILCTYSEEGETNCLDIIPAEIKKFNAAKTKVPHIGWNSVIYTKKNKLFQGIQEGEFFYFANSFYAPVNEFTTSVSENCINFSASMQKKNYYGVQFHPEKSSSAGQLIIKNFLENC